MAFPPLPTDMTAIEMTRCILGVIQMNVIAVEVCVSVSDKLAGGISQTCHTLILCIFLLKEENQFWGFFSPQGNFILNLNYY